MDQLQLADLLIKNITVYTQDATRKILPSVDVAVCGDKIVAIGALADQWKGKTTLDGTGKFLFPGMHNLHVHIFQSLIKGLGADLNLMAWIQKAPLFFGNKMTPKLQELACKVVAMESLKCGVTTMSDFNYVQHNDDLPHVCIQTMEQMGIRNIYMDCYHDTGADTGVCPEFIHPADVCIKRTDALVKAYCNDDHPLTRVFAGASVPWGTTEALYRAIAEYSDATGLPYTMHILETEEDNKFTMEHFNMPVVETLEKFGCLNDRLLAVHCVCLKPHEVEAFAKNQVNAVYCAASNTYLGSGIPPMAQLTKLGGNVVLGTDGAASNNSSDMIESLKLSLLLQKVAQRDSTALSAQNMLDYATVNGAKATKRPDLGTIEVGQLADMFIYDPYFVRSVPTFDPMATLMYNSSQENIETTIVGGKVAYHKGQFACGLDERSVAMEAQEVMTQFMKNNA